MRPPAYPSRPIRIIVGFPPGSGTDILARFVGGKLTERLGQQVVVDNRSGANGIIAAELTAKAAPDGHTLQFMSTSHTMNAAVYKLPFDAVKSFTPVGMLASGPLVLVTHPSFPATTVKGLIDLAKAKPNTISYAVSGTGGINHFAGASFSRMAGIQLLDVPYRGGPQALTDLIAGQVQIMFATLAITHRQVKAGKLAALGVSTQQARAPVAGRADDRGVRRAGLLDEHVVGRARARGCADCDRREDQSRNRGGAGPAGHRAAPGKRRRRARADGERRIRARARVGSREVAAGRARVEHQGGVALPTWP